VVPFEERIIVMAKKRFKNVAKPSRFATEAERYVEAARLVSVRNLTVLEAVREAGICIPDHVEVCKQVSWPESENGLRNGAVRTA
jgi:hypothetical protein